MLMSFPRKLTGPNLAKLRYLPFPNIQSYSFNASILCCPPLMISSQPIANNSNPVSSMINTIINTHPQIVLVQPFIEHYIFIAFKKIVLFIFLCFLPNIECNTQYNSN